MFCLKFAQISKSNLITNLLFYNNNNIFFFIRQYHLICICPYFVNFFHNVTNT